MSVPPRTSRYPTTEPHGHDNTGPYRHNPATSGRYGAIPGTFGTGVAGTGTAATSQVAATVIDTDPDQQKFSLSATQVLASMAAAVTAAFLGSRLGVAGTVIGAGLASVVTVVGSAVFGHSLLVTRKQVKKAVRQVRHADERAADAPTEVLSPVQPQDDRTTVIPAVTRYDLERARLKAASEVAPVEAKRTSGLPTKKTRRRIGTSLLVGVAATAAIFAGSLAAVTVVETVKGSPLSGGDSGGLSVLGGDGGSTDPGTVPTTAPTTTEMSTVTSTVTSPATEGTETEPTKSSATSAGTSSDRTTTSSSAPTTASSATSSVSAAGTTTDGSAEAPATN